MAQELKSSILMVVDNEEGGPGTIFWLPGLQQNNGLERL